MATTLPADTIALLLGTTNTIIGERTLPAGTPIRHDRTFPSGTRTFQARTGDEFAPWQTYRTQAFPRPIGTLQIVPTDNGAFLLQKPDGRYYVAPCGDRRATWSKETCRAHRFASTDDVCAAIDRIQRA